MPRVSKKKKKTKKNIKYMLFEYYKLIVISFIEWLISLITSKRLEMFMFEMNFTASVKFA